MELRLESGGLGSGRTRMWMRQRIRLLADIRPSLLQRLMTIADSGNGVSMVLDPQRFAVANPDLTVNVRRHARGEWRCLDAATQCQPHGLGMAESRMSDCDGAVTNDAQNLLFEIAR